VSPEKWRRSIQSPGFAQTLIVDGDKISEQDTGDYYPFWLRELVTALVDPLPMVESLKRTEFPDSETKWGRRIDFLRQT